MPRIRQNADRDAMNDLLKEIRAQAARFGLTSQKALGDALGLCQTTIGNYLREPDKIRMDNLRVMCKQLRLDPIVLLRALGYNTKEIKKSYAKEFGNE